MIRRPVLTFLLLVPLFFLGSCSKDKDIRPETGESEEPHRLVDEYLSLTYSIDEVKDYALTKYIEDFDGSPTLAKAFITSLMQRVTDSQKEIFAPLQNEAWHLEQHHFTYRSVTATGDSATMSGTLIYLQFNDKSVVRPPLDGLTIYNDKVKLNDYVGKIGLENAARAILNQAVVSADLEGFGVLNDRPVPYLDAFTKGRQSIDAAIAAKELLAMKGLEFKSDARTWNFGVSLGGHHTLGALKYFESDLCPQSVRDALPDLQTCATIAPIDISELFREYLIHDRLVFPFIPLMMISTIYAVSPEVSETYRFGDFLSDKVRTLTIAIDSVTYSLPDGFERKIITRNQLLPMLREATDGKLRQILTPDMFNSDGSFNESDPKSRILLQTLDRLSLSNDWYPRHHTIMSYSTTDSVVLYNSVRKQLEMFQNNGADIELDEMTGEHGIVGAISILDFLTDRKYR